MTWRRQLGLTLFLAGTLLPVATRIAVGRELALVSLPLAVVAVVIGGVLWIRKVSQPQ